MSRHKNTHDTINEVDFASCNFYIYGENFEYLLDVQGSYEKEGKVMGLARVLDILITAARLADKTVPCDKLVTKGQKGAVGYKAFGENRDFLINLKVQYKKKNLIPNQAGLKHVINSIITHTRLKK